MNLQIPENYDPVLNVKETQEAIKYIRDTFQREFGKEMNLLRISAPLFVTKSSGLNDNLNGIERPVSFDIQEMPGDKIEVVQSLAKWKRYALKKYGFEVHARMVFFCIFLQELHPFLTKVALRNIGDSDEGQIILEGNQTQVGQGILDFHAVNQYLTVFIGLHIICQDCFLIHIEGKQDQYCTDAGTVLACTAVEQDWCLTILDFSKHDRAHLGSLSVCWRCHPMPSDTEALSRSSGKPADHSALHHKMG